MAKKKIDWLNHTLEFAVVLIGILIAFQLNKCSDNQSKSKLLENHLQYIKLECEDNSAQLEFYISHTKEQIKYCDSILNEISTNKDVYQIRSFATKLLDMRNIDLVNDAYQVLSESGDIRYLEDFELKRAIIVLYDSFDDVFRINDSNQKLYDNHYYPYLKKNFDLVNWNYVQINSESEKEKYYAKEFANTISTYKFLLRSKLRIYSDEKKMIDAYLQQSID